MKLSRYALIILCSVFLLSTAAYADTVIVHNEDGIQFTLTISEAPGTVTATLVLGTSLYSTGGTSLHGVGLKILTGTGFDSAVTVTSAPTGTWTVKDGQINSNSVFPANSTGGGSGWFSALYSASGGPAIPDGDLTFVFTINSAGRTLLDEVSIKAIYVDGNGQFVDQTSSGPLTAPEPSTLLLLGTGLLAVGLLQRKRK